MNLLLNTHAFIWFMEDNPLLSRKASRAIENPENNIFISIASLYEIAIKLKGGKIGFDKPVSAFFNDITEYNLTLIPISEKHLIAYDAIPLVSTHKDPVFIQPAPIVYGCYRTIARYFTATITSICVRRGIVI